MQDLIEYLMTFNPVINSSHYSVGGNWEDAINISLDHPQGTEIVENVDESVAVEVFYELSDGRAVFLGVRQSNGLALTHSPIQFLQRVLGFINQAQHVSLREFMNLLGEMLNNDPLTYTGKPISYVELGVEGFWKSEGSLMLRKATDEKLSEETLRAQLTSHPHLASSAKNHTALEFAIDSPKAWIGVQVSHQEGGLFKTDLDALLTLVNLV